MLRQPVNSSYSNSSRNASVQTFCAVLSACIGIVGLIISLLSFWHDVAPESFEKKSYKEVRFGSISNSKPEQLLPDTQAKPHQIQNINSSTVEVCAKTGLLPVARVCSIVRKNFTIGHEPAKSCDASLHK